MDTLSPGQYVTLDTLPPGQYVIYALIDPIDEKVYYVGQTRTPQIRLATHLSARHHEGEKGDWLRRLKQTGQQPLMRILEIVTGEKAVLEKEQEWIRHFLEKKMPLFNAQVHLRGNDTLLHSLPIAEDRRSRIITPVAQAQVLIAGYPLIAVLLTDGQLGVVLTMLCAMLHLKPGTQAHLIHKHPVLSEALVQVALTTSGGTQTTNVLLTWGIALWAAGLQRGRRPPEYRELLLTIQREAGRTVAHQFAQ